MARFSRTAILALMVAAGIGGARAEDYPARTATIIVPFAAGGPADITGRIVADIFSRHLGQKFMVENVVGAGGTTGTLRAAKATDPMRSPAITIGSTSGRGSRGPSDTAAARRI